MSIDKVVTSAMEAVGTIQPGSSIAVGGFGLCGTPMVLIDAIRNAGIGDLGIVSNNCGVDDWGLGVLLADGLIATDDDGATYRLP